jgi:hypothetical protein
MPQIVAAKRLLDDPSPWEDPRIHGIVRGFAEDNALRFFNAPAATSKHQRRHRRGMHQGRPQQWQRRRRGLSLAAAVKLATAMVRQTETAEASARMWPRIVRAHAWAWP